MCVLTILPFEDETIVGLRTVVISSGPPSRYSSFAIKNNTMKNRKMCVITRRGRRDGGKSSGFKKFQVQMCNHTVLIIHVLQKKPVENARAEGSKDDSFRSKNSS